MRLIVLYRPISEHARVVEGFMHDFESRNTGVTIEKEDFDTKEGQAVASIYGIMQHPAIMALREDGQLLKQWEGPLMPLIDEVLAYLRS